MLLVLAVTIAVMVTKALVSRNPESPGVVTSAWGAVNGAIGKDKADDVN